MATVRLFVTAGQTSVTIPSTWNTLNNKVEAIGPGGSGLSGQAFVISQGGGGAAYSFLNNVASSSIQPGDILTCSVPVGATGNSNADPTGPTTLTDRTSTVILSADLGNSGSIVGGAGTGGSTAHNIPVGVGSNGGRGGQGGQNAAGGNRGGGGGGGAGGPNGSGGRGGDQLFGGAGPTAPCPGGGGGAADGGGDGSDATTGTVGGVGGGAGGGSGGTSGVEATVGTNGGGGGGGGLLVGNGGAASLSAAWDGSHGPGSGGGGGGGGSTNIAGAPAGYGGGGAGGGTDGAGANGGPGLIVLSWQVPDVSVASPPDRAHPIIYYNDWQ